MRSDLSRRERQILEELYRRGEATASEIQASVADDLANATIRTQLRILEEKGAVTHRRDGKRFVYRPAQSRRQRPRRRFASCWMSSSGDRWRRLCRHIWLTPRPDSVPTRFDDCVGFLISTKNGVTNHD